MEPTFVVKQQRLFAETAYSPSTLSCAAAATNQSSTNNTTISISNAAVPLLVTAPVGAAAAAAATLAASATTTIDEEQKCGTTASPASAASPEPQSAAPLPFFNLRDDVPLMHQHVVDGAELCVFIDDVEPGALLDSFAACDGDVPFNMPQGIVHDAQRDRTILCDFDNYRVVCMDACKRVVWQYGQTRLPGDGDARMRCVRACALSADGERVFVCDPDNHRIVVLDAESGVFVFQHAGGLEAPSGCGMTDSQHLWVADADRHSVVCFDTHAVPWAVVARAGVDNEAGIDARHLSFPRALVVHRERLFVADTGNGRIQVFRIDSDGDGGGAVRHVHTISRGRELWTPRHLAIGDNLLFCADSFRSVLRIFDATTFAYLGILTHGGPVHAGASYVPTGVCFDETRSRLVVTCAGTNRVCIFAAPHLAFLAARDPMRFRV